MNNLKNIFFNELTKKTSKWSTYFDIFERHFSKFINKPCNLLEIGIAHGGSIELWHKYFGDQCNIYGIDADKRILDLKFDFNVHLTFGNQSNLGFWKWYLQSVPKFDIVIDDGGHYMEEQIITLFNIFPHINKNGILLFEDTHTSFWKDWGGGLNNPNSFINTTKQLIDILHKQHINEFRLHENLIDTFNDLYCITYYNSVVVLEKKNKRIYDSS